MAKTIASHTGDTEPDQPPVAKLKRDLDCWEPCPHTRRRVLRHYRAGDPIPIHLTRAQRESLAAQDVI